jgi:hypothetical protein
MTVSSAQNKVSYAGDGSTTVFSVPFLFQANGDITAILRDGQGAETTWVEGTDYTLTGAGNPSGGTLTATTAPASGENLTIKRVVPLTQGTDYPEGGQFPAQAHEDALDRGTMADQQLQEQIDRTVKLKSTSALSDIDFPEPGADKGVKWNTAGTALVLTADDPDAAADSAAAAAASEAAAASSGSAAAASATAASSSESAAASSETNAATSKTDAEAAAGAVAYKWLFDISVTMADPGTGDVRLNNATLSAVTQIAISALTADTGNPDVSAFIVTWDDSLHSPRGTIVIRLSGTPATFVIYSINGTITDNGTWLQIPVAHVAGNGSLADTDKLFIHFLRSGDDGLGDLLAANNLSDLADIPTARTNLAVVGKVTVQKFESSGTYTKPSDLLYAIVEVQAPGGGSGGTAATSGGEAAHSGAGGAGGYAREVLAASAIGATETVTIGAVGAAGAAGNNAGGAGGATSFGSLLSATGGNGGAGGPNVSGNAFSAGGFGGVGSGGDLNSDGGDGSFGLVISATRTGTGDGGNSVLGGGGRATVDGVGQVGGSFGGGAGGSVNAASVSARTGADGGPAIIIVTEFRT